MSKGPENTFIAAVHRHLPADLYRIKNNNQFNSGQPDVWYSGNAADLWVEYKFITMPKRPETLIRFDLSDLQRHWLRSRYAEGRAVAVVVGCKAGGVYFEGPSWDRPYTAAEFWSFIESRPQIAERINRFTTQG